MCAVFERRAGGSCYEEDSPLAIQQVALCAESRRLAVALPHGHVVLFKFRKNETHGETHVTHDTYTTHWLFTQLLNKCTLKKTLQYW